MPSRAEGPWCPTCGRRRWRDKNGNWWCDKPSGWPCPTGSRGANGCFVRGTKVLLGNGEEKEIEKLQAYKGPDDVGDVIFSIDGSIAYVAYNIAGPEKIPVVHIEVEAEDGDEFAIGMTAFHPVIVRYNYLVSANILQEGDRVHTIKGEAKITKIERREYDDEVFNFVLASKEFIDAMQDMTAGEFDAFRLNSLLGLVPKDHIVFSNGIATADWNLQVQLKAALRGGINISQFA